MLKKNQQRACAYRKNIAKEKDVLKSEIPIFVIAIGSLVQKRRIIDQKSAEAMSKLS